MDEPSRELQDAVAGLGSGELLVVTGAGASRGSGIATFRGPEPDAVWKQSDLRKATFEYFLEDPVGQWRWYLARFDALAGARPNPGHLALAALEGWHEARGGRFLLVTQNIDTLHEAAGSRNLIKVHGTSDRVRCSQVGCLLGSPGGSLPRSEIDLERFRAAPGQETLPRCPRCGAPLRAHVLFFDEFYTEHRDYRFAEVEAAARTADLVLFVGTSFSVGVTDLLLQAAARRRLPVFSIDPAGARLPSWLRVRQLAAAAEEALPRLCDALGAPAAS